jgi:hypothetical protein
MLTVACLVVVAFVMALVMAELIRVCANVRTERKCRCALLL